MANERADDRDVALQRHENLNRDREDDHKEYTLQEKAKERAKHHPTDLNAGTPFDWEDIEAYKEELERLEREGPRLQNP